MNTNTKHTPGTWTVQDHVGDYKTSKRLFIVSQAIERSNCSADVIIAEMEWHRFGSADRKPTSRQEQEANARLIASAPDLAEALKAIIATFDQEGWTATGAMQVQRSTVIEEARAALAKAGL